ncbi:MAG TPA: glycosyltransferase [Pyrinomonadaceae bacterium]
MTAPIRVAHVIGALSFGGVEAIALDLLRRLPSETVRSNVYYIGEELTERRREFEEASERFVHCPYRSPRRVNFVRRLSATFRQDDIDSVLSYSFGNHAWVSMAARLAGVRRCFVTVQGSPTRDRSTQRKSSILAHLARPFCTGEIAASKQVGDELVRGLRLPQRRVHIVNNACNVSEIAGRAAKVRRERAKNDPPIVLMVARMDDAKDQPTLIRACAQLIRSGFTVRLRFAGDGPDRAKHEALCRDEGIKGFVEFLGSRSDVPELLGECDLAVLATHTEGFGIVLAEAMSAGTPVIATDIPVCRDVLDSGKCGLLVPPRNAEALADAIRRLLKDEALREGLAREGFTRAVELYDIQHLVGKYAALLTGNGAKSEKNGTGL